MDQDSFTQQNHMKGLTIHTSKDITINNLHIEPENQQGGVSVFQSENVTLADCTVLENSGIACFISDSKDVALIRGNYGENEGDGLLLIHPAISRLWEVICDTAYLS